MLPRHMGAFPGVLGGILALTRASASGWLLCPPHRAMGMNGTSWVTSVCTSWTSTTVTSTLGTALPSVSCSHFSALNVPLLGVRRGSPEYFLLAGPCRSHFIYPPYEVGIVPILQMSKLKAKEATQPSGDHINLPNKHTCEPLR